MGRGTYSSFFFYFLEAFVYNWHYFFFECLVEIIYEAVQDCSFFVGRILVIDSLCFVVFYKSIQIFPLISILIGPLFY